MPLITPAPTPSSPFLFLALPAAFNSPAVFLTFLGPADRTLARASVFAAGAHGLAPLPLAASFYPGRSGGFRAAVLPDPGPFVDMPG